MSTDADLQARIATLEAQLEAVFAAAPVLMFALDARGVITMAQGKLLDNMGITPDQIIGHTAETFYSDMPDAVALVNRALAGESVTITTQVGPLCLQITYTPYFDGVLCVAIDLTHWTQAEQAAQQQREFLTKVINALPVRVFWKNADLVYEGCNQVFAEDAGLSEPAQIIGRTDYNMGWAEQADLYRADDRAVIESGQARLNFEEPQSRPDGSTGWLRTSKIPLHDASGGVAGVLGVYEDITQWKQAQLSLHEQQSFLRKVMDALPVRVFWKDAVNFTFLGCNQLLAQDLGAASPDDLIGKSDYDMTWTTEQAAAFRQDDKAVVESGRARLNFEEPQQRPDGTVGWLRTSKIPILDASGTVTSVLGVYEDITERKLADAERERLQQQVIDAQREALADLSSPIIPIMDNVIVMPLVGSIDSVRSRDIMRALLRGISEHRVKVVILDITGVPMVDSGVADHLNHTIQAARLKGAHTIVTGISDAVAETIIDLGIDWSQVETLTDLQSGLIAALARMGVRLTTSNRTDSGK